MEAAARGAVSGQVALVTGGGRGIGRAIAEALAAAGAAVAVGARSADALAETVGRIESAGGRALAVTVDVTEVVDVTSAVEEVERHLGPIDLLVNNAGAGTASGPLWEGDPEAWWRDVTVNLRGPFLCARAVLPGMIARGRGRIVNVASRAGVGPYPFASAYGVGKTALIRLTETLALELRGKGLSVFAIHPGVVRTAMVDATLDDPWVGPRFRQLLEQGADVPPERAAALVVALARGQGDRLTGRYITVDDDLAQLTRAVQANDALHTLRLVP